VKGFAENTLRVRRVHIEMFLTWCKRARIALPNEVTRTSLESYQRYLFHYRKKDGQPLAIASQHSRLAPLKVWFKWLTLRDYISEDHSSVHVPLIIPKVSL
jgi:integrase/recombinase XerD